MLPNEEIPAASCSPPQRHASTRSLFQKKWFEVVVNDNVRAYMTVEFKTQGRHAVKKKEKAKTVAYAKVSYSAM